MIFVHDDVGDPRQTHVGTMMMMMMMMPRIDASGARCARATRSVVTIRTRSGLGLIDHQPWLQPPTMTFIPTNALRTIVAALYRPFDVVTIVSWHNEDLTFGGVQQTTSLLLRGPLGLDLRAFLMLTADPDHVWIRVVLLFEHRAHFTHATGLFAMELAVGSIAVLRYSSRLTTVARFVTDAAADAAVVVAALGVHNRMTTSTDRERYMYIEGGEKDLY